MTNLKFRAWHKAEKVMFDVGQLAWCQGGLLVSGQGVFSGCWATRSEEYRDEPIEVVLMQSTGFKDKNGVEIFEGDILRREREPIKVSAQMYIKHPECFEETDITTFDDGFQTRQGIIKTYCFAVIEKEICPVTGSIHFKCYELPKRPNPYTASCYQLEALRSAPAEIIANIYTHPHLLTENKE